MKKTLKKIIQDILQAHRAQLNGPSILIWHAGHTLDSLGLAYAGKDVIFVLYNFFSITYSRRQKIFSPLQKRIVISYFLNYKWKSISFS
jgi:hypothetical protein